MVQVGKSTLARAVAGPNATFDLERPSDLAALADAEVVLEPLRGLVVLDEVQRLPSVFGLLRVLGTPARFLVLGSASPDLLHQGSESLAGRISWHQLPGFTLGEVGVDRLDRLWLRGGFPRSFLAADDAVGAEWRRAFVSYDKGVSIDRGGSDAWVSRATTNAVTSPHSIATVRNGNSPSLNAG